MKNSKQILTILSLTVISVLLMGTSSHTKKKTSTEVSKFKIIVQPTKDGLKFTCKEGCAWKELAFSTSWIKRTQAIDQYGMTSLRKREAKKETQLGNFLITTKKTKDGLILEGLEGTAWTNLSFSCDNCLQAIDQNGMTSQN